MAIAALLLSLWAGAAAICEEPNVRYQGVQLSTERGLEDVSACRASCVNTLGCQHFSFTEKKVISMEELMRRKAEAERKAEEEREKEEEKRREEEARRKAEEQAEKEKEMAKEAKEAAAEQAAKEKKMAEEAKEAAAELQAKQEAKKEELEEQAKEKAEQEAQEKELAEATEVTQEQQIEQEATEEEILAKAKEKAREDDLKRTAEANSEDLEVESPEESTEELTEEPDALEAEQPETENIQAKVAAQQEKLKAQLLKMLGTPTEERRLDGNPIRKLQDQTIAPSVCVLFDSTSQKEPADSEKRITSGSVSCPASEQRPPLGHVELGQIFKEVDRGSQAPGSVFLQRGPRPTNAWWSQTFINKNLGDQSNFLTQMPYIIGADKKGVHVMQPFMTSPGMEEFQHGLGVFFGAEGELTGPYADSWDEACVTLTYRGSNPGQALSFPSCRGSAYVTAELRGLKPSISSDLPLAVPHQIRVDGKPVTCGDQNFVQGKEIEFTLSTGDIWIAFFPAGMGWTCQLQPFRLTAAEIAPAKGVAVRLAMLKGKNSGEDAGWADLVRKHAATYPVTSGVDYAANEEEDVAQVIFDWRNRRTIPGLEECDALQLLWPHQVSLMAEEEKSQVESAPKTPFKDLRGEPKVFVARSPLVLRYPLYPTHEFAGRHPVPPGTLRDMILEALKGGTHMAGSKYDGAKSDSEFELPQNVKLGVGDTYFSGKLLARMARLVAIADELGLSNEAFVNRMLTELADTLGKWLGKGAATPFIYDKSWGGLVSCGCTYDDCWGSCAPKCTNDISQPTTCPALNQVGYNFGNGFYNDHHFHYGYFIYSAAVLAKFRPEWEQQWRPQILALIRDYANPSSADQMFPLARHKDWFMGFSWAGGIKFEPLGRNQESVSEAINSYYAIACYGTILMKRGGEAKELGVQLRQLGRLFTAMEIHSGDMFWHVRPQAEILSNYPHPTVGIMWEHVALHQTWFGGAGWAVEGIQMLPVIPVLEDFLKKDWVQNHFLQYQDSCENDPSCKHLGWSWLVCIQQAVLSVEDAYDCLRRLDESAFSLRSPAASGNSLTNSLYWFATRDERPDVEPWPVAQAQVITTPQPGSQTPQDFGPIHKFGHHGVRMNNNCFKNNDVACPKVPSIRCISESCCPDGSLCPSAPFYSSPMCKTPKQVACRGTDGDDPAMKKVQKSKDGHCPVGSVVMCPDGKTSCQQSQCCPDNSLCPSAPASAQGACLKPKAHDCTGLGKKKVVKYKMEKQCQVGERVKCADANVKCWGSMCCPDGAPCPSAAKTTKCWKPKFADCTPPDTTLPPTEKPWFRDFGQERSQSRSHEERDSYGDSYGDSIDSRHSRYSDEEGGDFYGDSSYDSSFDSRRSRYSDEEPSRDFYGSDGSGYSDEEGDSFGEDSYGDSIDSRRSRYSDEEPSRDFYGSSGDSEERSSEFFGGSSNSEDASDSWGDDFGDSFQDRDRMAKDDEASKVSDEAKSSGEAECDESRKCMWGESVLCPDKKSRCAGSGCCPDGSMCPSAPPGATGCSMGKAFDCTCAPKPKIIGHASCLIGASVPCPDDPSTKCSMAGCCPDGSTCPSAPLGTMCPFPKKKDCTGQTIAKYDASIEEFQPNVFRSFNPYASAAIASAMVIAAFTLLVVKGRSASRHYIIVPEGEA